MAEVSLTRGAIAIITEGGATAEGLKPILQVTEVRLLSTTHTTTERYRMTLYDGVSQQPAMLATQVNAMVKSGQLQKGSVVQLTEHVCNTIHGRRIIIIINLEVLDISLLKVGAAEITRSAVSCAVKSQRRMAEVSLTRGAIATIIEGGATAEGLKPILQVTEVRLMSTTHTTMERYRMTLYDGVSQQPVMLATQVNAMVQSGQLQKGSVVQLTEHVCNTIKGRRIIIVINLEVLDKSDAIGAPPKIYESGSTVSQNHAPMPAQSSGMV